MSTIKRKSMFEDMSEIPFKRCECCGTTFGVERKRQNTAYVYPEELEGQEGDPNYATLCSSCWIENEEFWAEMWKEYWQGRL